MIIGEKVILEEIDPDNIETLRQWRNDPELRKHFREFRDISKQMQKNWYEERGNGTNPNHIYFQIMERVSEEKRGPLNPLERELVGCVGLHYIDWRIRSAEFGVFLGRGFQGRGLGKEALLMVFDEAFFSMGIHKVWAECYEFNQALGLYKNGLGMHEDGRLRHNQFYDGKYWDSIMLSVLEDEWRTFRNK